MANPQDVSISSLFDVKGKVALVSGGGSGLGQMIATALVENGARVYIVSRKEKQLKEVSDALNAKRPGSCQYLLADLSTKAGCDSIVAKIKERENKLHILVNNSGASWNAPLHDVPEVEGWDRILAINLKGVFYMTAGLSDLLAKDSNNLDPGRVINVSSVASLRANAQESELHVTDPGKGTWSYYTSKAAVNHLTSQLAVTLAPKCITVNAICPGVFPSKITAFAYRAVGEESLSKSQPMGRLGNMRDIAGVTLFLLSPASAHITGALIPIDGGATLYNGRHVRL